MLDLPLYGGGIDPAGRDISAYRVRTTSLSLTMRLMSVVSPAEGLVGRLDVEVDAAVAGLRRLRSAQSRLVAATRVLSVLRAAQDAVVVVRDRAINELVSAGRTYAELGQLTGLTRGRVSQIVQDHAQRSKDTPGSC